MRRDPRFKGLHVASSKLETRGMYDKEGNLPVMGKVSHMWGGKSGKNLNGHRPFIGRSGKVRSMHYTETY
jgi:hypothetical protein